MALVRAVAAFLLAASAASAETGTPVVLLVVPPGSSVADVQRARAAVGDGGIVRIVGDSGTIPVREGVSIVADSTVGSPLAADAVAALAGPLSEEMVRFLSGERGLARVILLAEPGPAVERVRTSPGSALVAIGGVEALPSLLARPAEPAVAPARIAESPAVEPPAAPAPAPPAKSEEKPAAAPEPKAAPRAKKSNASAPAPKSADGESAFDRYFSTGASASGRPKPAPPN